MNEIFTLFGELFFVACVHFFIINFIDGSKAGALPIISNIACTSAALLILLRFVAVNVIPEAAMVFRPIF